jgi:hypothetical protein
LEVKNLGSEREKKYKLDINYRMYHMQTTVNFKINYPGILIEGSPQLPMINISRVTKSITS